MHATPAIATQLTRTQEERLAYGGLVVSTIGWASAFVIGKFVLVELSALSAGALRYAFATAILLPFAIRSRPNGELRRVLLPLTIMLLCGGVIYQWLFLGALTYTTATNTALLIALNPVFTVLLAPLVGEPLSRDRLTGVALALVGAVVVTTRGELAVLTGLQFNLGDLLALAAAANWAAFNLASRGTVQRLSPAFTNCVIYGIGGVILFLLASPARSIAEIAAASPSAIAGVGAMAVLSSVVAGQLFLVGVRALGVSRTVVFIYLVPVLTALLSTTVLGEPFGTPQVVGGAAVLFGVYMSSRSRVVLSPES